MRERISLDTREPRRLVLTKMRVMQYLHAAMFTAERDMTTALNYYNGCAFTTPFTNRN